MAIPKLSSYAMPPTTTFPKGKVAWPFEPERAVLLIHDMQRYFLDFYPDGAPIVAQLLTNVARLKRHCRVLGMQAIYTAQPIDQAPEDRGLLNDMWGPGIDNKPDLKDIAEGIRPNEDDIVLKKWRYSAFQKSDLASMMTGWKKDQILICGVYGHIGCLMTAANAFMLDIKPFVVGDAIADFTRDDHLMTLSYTAALLGRVTSVEEVVRS